MRLATLLGNLVRYGAVALIVNAAPAMAEPFRLLALGDSLTAGYGVAAADSFPAQLERALRAQGHDVTVINAGVSGDTSASGKARLDWSMGDRPNAAIVELGANDGLRGLDVGQMEANLDNIVGRLKGAGIKVLLTGMRAPPNYGADYAQSYAAVFPRVARRHQVAFYPFFLEGVARDPRFNQPDGLHPTALGVAEIVRRMLPEVTALLKPEEKK